MSEDLVESDPTGTDGTCENLGVENLSGEFDHKTVL